MITPLIKLRDLLSKNPPAGGLDAILISSVSNIVYLTNYSGFSRDEREAYLFATKNQQYILTDGRYSTAVKTLIPDFKLIEISPKLSFEKALKNLIKKNKIKKIGFEGNDISFLEHKKLLKYFNNIYHLSISNLRSIKTLDEISKIEKACQLGDKTFDYILKQIKLGVSEKELANEIELFIKKAGGDISFSPIVAFGKNSAIPHHQITNNKLTNNEIVLLDFGVKLANYCSDMTRTIFFGKAPAEFKKMHKTVLKAQSLAINYLSRCHAEFISASQNKEILKRVQDDTGVKASDVDKIARDYIISQGYKTIPHSLGHGIGLEVHEQPRLSPTSKDVLKRGMVFSIEPGIYTPNFGGVRIEDLVVLEKSGLPRRKAGPHLLTHSPRHLIEI